MTGPLVPFREFVLKVHSRCDLACDHCYVYEHADQSWLTRPKAISDEAISWTARRLAEHATIHALPSVTVILHGGEPLLAGPARLRRVCEELGSALNGIAELDLRIHTNGVQLSPRYLDLFDEFHVRVGISLDGDRAANDRHRRYADGRSSHPMVLRAVGLLREERYRHLDLGLLCTVDIHNDPVAVHDALAALEPPLVDFLLPHATWDDPPPRPDGSPTAYAAWLLTVFDRWTEQGRPMPVRMFASVLSSLSGGPSLTESLGLAPTDLVVIETDGKLEQVDSLKSAYEGAAATGFDVFRNTFDEVAAHPGVRARQLGLAGVSETCRRCPVVRSCGGGLYTHRYRSDDASGGGFDHPSVYSDDLAALIRGIEERTAAAIASPAVRSPDALLTAHQDLTRTLLAVLHDTLDGRGGALWDDAWRLAAAVEADATGADALDTVLAHPYTRTWLVDALADVDAGRGLTEPAAERLAATVAAAAVRARLDLPVPVAYRDGSLHLPTLGTVLLGGPGKRGTAVVHSGDGGFLVRETQATPGTGRRIAPDEPEGPHWLPVRVLRRAPAPAVLLDDLDPLRDCFDAPAADRLAAKDAEAWAHRIAEAWSLLADAVPDQAAEAARTLTTITPLATGAAAPGRHGPGALGTGPVTGADELALGLLSGFRRAKLRALGEVTDLYALDGTWDHRTPWGSEHVPFSRLLAETFERAGLGLYDPRFLTGVPEALDMIENAAEVTVDGKQLIAAVRKEISGTRSAAGKNRGRILSPSGPLANVLASDRKVTFE
ncbi:MULTISPECIES: radical SAM/SPASM protein FxsBH, inactivated beta-hydroxylase extension form [Streptomyces]|uniref:radical SAM/SPASM protein FxsBH, inactivated beta-hydroxylase extension form n=1 Tax=Streptomyces TaxID=1883 RepID=UPI001FADF483|nr:MULTISPECIES: radical SAM/SPASM protein FxsB, inactivated metallohydrolase extension form [unclassified Streptomyces]MDX2918801.1 radical SAM/SPASM protein FxsB, inactivated metallohydrolase extension form [Streptomyces sp. NE06-03C]MDX3606637.1 radical SAM/SPASM protein FxsB, inactivated metallohydrolase extension form [Streptomyces sp. FL06-04B]MDX3737440.1 radical SAM/SPASM protein FxsB, inactivated metallohydrolase extension form [Streptomyces sp. ID01-15D]